jgi:benzylsuccinate CoA-transferase BbsF subunit
MGAPAWRFDRTPAHVRLPAPCFAEHNDYVFRELLGLSDEEVAGLEREGVTSREPLPGQDV